MRILCVCTCVCACVRKRKRRLRFEFGLFREEKRLCASQPPKSAMRSKLQPSDSSSACCVLFFLFFILIIFPSSLTFPAAILCNFVVSCRREFLRWLWSEGAGQSRSLPQIGARCHQGSRSNGERRFARLISVHLLWFYAVAQYNSSGDVVCSDCECL